jgi:hypothetical protein
MDFIFGQMLTNQQRNKLLLDEINKTIENDNQRREFVLKNSTLHK